MAAGPDAIPLTPIGGSTMRKAITISEYFMATGLEVVGRLADPLQLLPAKHRIWYEELPEELTTDVAVQAGEVAEVSERTVKRLLTNKDLFCRVKRGTYEKLLF